MQTTIKERFYDVLIPADSNEIVNRYFNLGMLLLISLNVLAVMFETEQGLYLQNKKLFDLFEVFSVIIFSIEYILRIWVCTKREKFSSPILGRIKFALQPLQLIDLLAILPFYIPFFGVDLRFVRAVRLFRLFRLLKMGRYSQSLTTLSNVIKSKKEELSITLFAGFVILIIASSLIYLVEHDAQPEVFHSIPDSMWWGVVTLTTVGYGDAYPKTEFGKVIGAFIALLGIGLFALPAGIIASGFASGIQKDQKGPKVCPHCGKNLEE